MKTFILDTNTWLRAAKTDIPYINQANSLQIKEIKSQGHPSLIRNEIMKRLANGQKVSFTQNLLTELRAFVHPTNPKKSDLTREEKENLKAIVNLVEQIIQQDPICILPGVEAIGKLEEHENIIKKISEDVNIAAIKKTAELTKFQKKFLEKPFPSIIPEHNDKVRRLPSHRINAVKTRIQAIDDRIFEFNVLSNKGKKEPLKKTDKEKLEQLKKCLPEDLITKKQLRRGIEEQIWIDLETIMVAKAHSAEVVSGDIDCKILGAITQTPIAHIQTDEIIAGNKTSPITQFTEYLHSYYKKVEIEQEGFTLSKRINLSSPAKQEEAEEHIREQTASGKKVKILTWGKSKGTEIFTKSKNQEEQTIS